MSEFKFELTDKIITHSKTPKYVFPHVLTFFSTYTSKTDYIIYPKSLFALSSYKKPKLPVDLNEGYFNFDRENAPSYDDIVLSLPYLDDIDINNFDVISRRNVLYNVFLLVIYSLSLCVYLLRY
jgi:hypothetical protein